VSVAGEAREVVAPEPSEPGSGGQAPTVVRALRRLVVNPLIVKDGLSRMRSWRAPAVIAVYLVMLGLFAWLAFSVQLGDGGLQRFYGFARVGSTVFTALAVVQLALVCLFTPGVAAGAISGERERQTLDVLLVSCVPSFSIVWGKLVASVAFIVLLILAALPLFAAVFLLGGIDASQFVVAQLVTVTTALTTGAVSLFLSALFRRTLAATVVAYGITFAATAGTWIVGTILTSAAAAQLRTGPPPAHPLLWFNPIHAILTALQGGSGSVPGLGRVTTVYYIATGQTGPNAPAIEPWHLTVVAQLVVVVLGVIGTVWLLRERRGIFRGSAPS
jgi:ABC-type transport system involved in multi-copper enzyme maturation permease subunit